MTTKINASLQLSDRDLDFLVEVAAPDVRDKSNLKRIIRQDHDFRKAKKPLHFIAEYYLRTKRHSLFV